MYKSGTDVPLFFIIKNSSKQPRVIFSQLTRLSSAEADFLGRSVQKHYSSLNWRSQELSGVFCIFERGAIGFINALYLLVQVKNISGQKIFLRGGRKIFGSDYCSVVFGWVGCWGSCVVDDVG